jgi:5-(carboxyamino)imidazole ribonucleotide mutase
MPGGIPVAAVAIGNAKNAGLLAARILGTSDDAVTQRLTAYAEELRETAHEKGKVVRDASAGPRKVGF